MTWARKAVVVAISATMVLAALAGPATAQGGSNQRFEVLFVNTQEEATIVGAGPISGRGKVFFLTEEEHDDGSFTETYRARFSSGEFILTITGANESFTFDPRSCVLRATNRGTFTIGTGTGDFDTVTGQGSFVFRLVEVRERGPEGCTEEGRGVGVLSLAGNVQVAA